MSLVLAIGSASRGDFDATSDRDALLIGSVAELNRAMQKLEVGGWSVTAMTAEKFSFLASSGSLFLKHAIDEGRVLSDGDGLWPSLKRSWRYGAYREEIEDNLDQLRVLRSIPNSNHGCLVAIDIIVCSIRNILIRRLASKGLFVFSWGQISQEGKKVACIPVGAWSALQWARRCKNLHRVGYQVAANPRVVEHICYLFRDVLGVRGVQWVNSSKAIERVAMSFKPQTYGQLRAYELLCAAHHADLGLARLRALATSPSYFCSGRVRV